MGFVSWKGYGYYMDWRQKDDYIGNGDQPVQIVIEDGWGWSNVADTLVAQDVIRDPTLFVNDAIQLTGPNGGPNHYGTWNLKTHLPAATALQMLTDPKNLVKLSVTIPEGLRLDQVFPILIDKVGLTQDDINQAVAAAEKDPASIHLNAAAKNDLEGFLFPDTYVLYPPVDSDPTSILTAMADEFNTVAKTIDLDAKAKALKVSTQQAVVIASLIEAEVSQDADRAKVARVIYNRLADNMPLGVESAFRYGRLMADGTPYNDPITQASMQDASLPYNVYTNPGLPKTPIDSPGQASLEAAVNPAAGNWLYWVTVNLDTGETKFASDEAGFQELVGEFQAWCAANGNPTGCS